MIFVLQQTVCKCGSNEVSQGCQYHDSDGEFHTKQWWLEHPDEIRPSVQKAFWVADPTNCTCAKCGYKFSFQECETLAPEMEINLNSGLIVKEHVGAMVINPKALEHVRISR